MEGTGTITWDNGASIYEASAGRLYITAGLTNIDLEPNQITFFEGGAGGQMRFFDNHLEVSAISTLSVEAQQGMATSSLTVSSINGAAYPPPSGSVTNSISTLLVSTILPQGPISSIFINNPDLASLSLNNAGDIIGVATNFINFQAQGTGGQLAGFVANAGGAGSWSNYATGPMYLNASTIRMSTNQVQMVNLSTSVVGLFEADFQGLSTVTFSTSAVAGAQTQPAGRLVMSGNDLDLGQQDLWCQQIKVGAGNTGGGSAPSEISFYNPNGTFVRSLGLGNNDVTIRVQSTINTGTSAVSGADTKMLTQGSSNSSSRRLFPIRIPTGMPMMMAKNTPAAKA
jgi:hypothetical protein